MSHSTMLARNKLEWIRAVSCLEIPLSSVYRVDAEICDTHLYMCVCGSVPIVLNIWTSSDTPTVQDEAGELLSETIVVLSDGLLAPQ